MSDNTQLIVNGTSTLCNDFIVSVHICSESCVGTSRNIVHAHTIQWNRVWQSLELVSENSVVSWLGIIGIGNGEVEDALIGTGWEIDAWVRVGRMSLDSDGIIGIGTQDVQLEGITLVWQRERKGVLDSLLDLEWDAVSGEHIIVIVISWESYTISTKDTDLIGSRSQELSLEALSNSLCQNSDSRNIRELSPLVTSELIHGQCSRIHIEQGIIVNETQCCTKSQSWLRCFIIHLESKEINRCVLECHLIRVVGSVSAEAQSEAKVNIWTDNVHNGILVVAEVKCKGRSSLASQDVHWSIEGLAHDARHHEHETQDEYYHRVLSPVKAFSKSRYSSY